MQLHFSLCLQAFIRASMQTDMSRPIAGLESQRIRRDNLEEIVPVWAELYFLLRSGAPKAVRDLHPTPHICGHTPHCIDYSPQTR